ncbi:hypothetical protein [Nocardia sp. NPDC058705]|uniref:hypothetical protein n=1 Tax=Nocardia sp. NPDC058705 TaxID=3346609 RepID=UPI0036B587C2
MLAVTVMVIGCCLWIMWADLTVFADGNTRFFAGLCLAIPVMGWAVLAMVGSAKYPGWWRLGVLAPLFVTLTVVLTWFDVFGRIGWAMSRGDMDRAAAACPARVNSTSYIEGAVGVYRFYDIERLPDRGCQFRLARDYQVVRTGFLYLPNEKRRRGVYGHTYYEPLGGNWYFYEFNE